MVNPQPRYSPTGSRASRAQALHDEVKDRLCPTSFENLTSFYKKTLWYNTFVMINSDPAAKPKEIQQQPLPSTLEEKAELKRQRLTLAGIAIGVLIILALMILAVIYLAKPSTPTDKIRDIFIIFMALEFLLLGLALIILIVQLATLINLLQNEVKPILESTNETANTLRGTAVFLSENLTGPVIKLNEYIAALKRLIELMGFFRK